MDPSESNIGGKNLKDFFKHYFDLNLYKEDEEVTIETLKSDTKFQGPRIWILICAILICSIGLNLNSTAVIIGAMLISPLMGPIIGIGLGLGITDLTLVKDSVRNFTFAVIVSILTSATYFWISPISNAATELLARTQPTTFDLLIGFFGGFAGLIATATKSKGQVIPGVAIATALMPPLCTAGYGIGTGQFRFFWGASYLFLINAVFIGLATLIAVRVLKFRKVAYVNKSRSKRLNRIVITIVVCTAVPSVFLAYNMIEKTYRDQKVKSFVYEELIGENNYVLNYNYIQNDSANYIKVSMLGQKFNDDELSILQEKLQDYNLKNTYLIVDQGYDQSISEELKHTILNDIQNRNTNSLSQYLRLQNDSLRQKLDDEQAFYKEAESVNREVGQLFDKIVKTDIGFVLSFCTDSIDTIPVIRLHYIENLNKEEKNVIQNWLRIRYKEPEVEFIKTVEINK